MSAPGAPVVEPGTTAAWRGCPRTIVPGRIVQIAPFVTNSVAWRMIGLGLAAPPQVVLVVMSVETTVCAIATEAPQTSARASAAAFDFRIMDLLFRLSLSFLGPTAGRRAARGRRHDGHAGLPTRLDPVRFGGGPGDVFEGGFRTPRSS